MKKIESKFSGQTFLLVLTIVFGCMVATPGRAQTNNCIDTPDGRICTVKQEIRQGVLVPVDTQRERGLVTVAGGCSGTLVNRFWVLTADHCVTSTGKFNGPSAALTALPITAAWSTRAPIPTRLVRNLGASGLDVALIFLGAGDFGQVNIQLFFGEDVEKGMTLTKYGQGIFEYASAGPPPVAAQQDGRYRSAGFTVANASATGYTLPVNSAGQVGEGGDSGGPDIVTAPNGVGLGIAGVQSTCQYSGRVDMPDPPLWTWVTGITSCDSAAISTIRWDILQIIQEGTNPCPNLSSECLISVVQRHVDGKLWAWDGRTPCTATACPGWALIDTDPRTQEIAASENSLFMRQTDGKVWKWYGRTPCTDTACPAWGLIDKNPRTAGIVAAGNTLYQRHEDGKLWKWDGSTPCTATACPGWTLIDMNPRTQAIAATESTLYQRHVDGKLWKWDGRTPCTASACPGWTLIDMNSRTAEIVAAGNSLYQRHADGNLWKWDGRTPCTATACPGWTLIDMNPRTQAIAATGSTLFQRHVDGKLWKWDGRTPCTATACPGWTLIDTDPRTREIAAGGDTLFMRQVDGKLWKWDGHTPCTATACPGWTLIDMNPRTQAIVSFGPIKGR